MFEIIHESYDGYGKLISSNVVKTVCSKNEAKRLLEMVYRSDSFDKYKIKDKRWTNT